ncbi:MAG: hypothetical protein ABSH38_19110 [Verrucomicrobiota bacterium]|jgi:hypothetical protein
MARLRLHPVILLALFGASWAFGQPLFRVYPRTEVAGEGTRENVLLMEAGNERFELGVPRGYGTQIHLETLSIVFTSRTGASVISVQVSTNYPAALPKQEDLRNEVARKYPGASLVQSSVCFTDFGPGQCFELIRPVADGLTVRLRDAYVSYPEGSFEFTFTCNGADYDKEKLSFTRLLNSFRLQPEPAKKNP